jgi:hypothetical protein
MRNMDGKKSRRRGGEKPESQTVSGHENRNGHEDLPASTKHVLQPPSPSLPQAVISEDDALIQTISRTIAAHREVHTSDLTHNPNRYPLPSSVINPPNAQINEELALVANNGTNDRDTELAGVIVNLIRDFRHRNRGEASSTAGTAPPAYREDP